MCDHWAEFGPPAYRSIAHALGMTKPKPKRIQPEAPEDLYEFVQGMFPEGWG